MVAIFLVYYVDFSDNFELEITWLRDRKKPYDLEDNEIHLCFRVEDYEAALNSTREMGVVSLKMNQWVFILSKIRWLLD